MSANTEHANTDHAGNQCSEKPTAVIFGASQSGQSALKNLRQQYRIVAFSDNCAALAGTQIDDIVVIPPESIATLMPDKVFIASEFFEQIQQQLVNDLGINRDSVVVLPTSIIKPMSLGDSDTTLQTAEFMLLTVCRCLRAHDVPHHIDAGTLLGIYRDGGLIPWDDDLDIAVSSEFIDHAKQALISSIAEIEQYTQRTWQVEMHYSARDFGAVRKGDIRGIKLKCSDNSPKADKHLALPMLDIFFKYITGDTMDYVLASRGLTMPSTHLRTTDNIEFCGESLAIPSDVEDYLQRHYGDWQTPIRDWHLGMLQNATVFR